MLKNIDYTDNGKIIEYTNYSGEVFKIPASFVDEMFERKISSYTIDDLLRFREFTHQLGLVKTTAEQLVGKDLTNKSIYYYYAIPYEDGSWESVPDGAVSGVVKSSRGNGFLEFALTPDGEKCATDECEHYENGDYACMDFISPQIMPYDVLFVSP